MCARIQRIKAQNEENAPRQMTHKLNEISGTKKNCTKQSECKIIKGAVLINTFQVEMLNQNLLAN